MSKPFIAMIALASLLIALCPFAAAQWSEPVPITELNDIGNEFRPQYSLGGSALIFMAEGTITRSDWLDSLWGPRQYYPFPINYVGLQRAAALTPDGQWMYWVSWRSGGMGMWDIWRSRWDDSCQCWGPAELLGPNINSAYIEWGMCFTADGSRMYFVTEEEFKNGQQGYGYMDIWYVDWDSTINDWGLPYNVGEPVNSINDEESPYVSADGLSLYFCCWGAHGEPGWQGEYDIYKAIWNGTRWDSVVNVGPPINSPYTERDPTISPQNNKLVFAKGTTADFDLVYSLYEGPNAIEVIEPIRLIDVEVYPNPANSKVRIAFNGYAICKLSIINSLGSIVREFDKNNLNGYSEIIWDGKDSSRKEVSSGVYFIVCIDCNDSVVVRKSIMLK